MKNYPRDAGSKMPRRMGGAFETEMGGAQKRPHPNGGEARALGKMEGRMQESQSTAPITHTDLDVELGKMPRSVGGGRQLDPMKR